MNCLTKNLRKVDMLGYEFNLFYKSSSKYKTAFGGSLTMMAGCASIALIAIFTIILFRQDEPLIASSKRRSEDLRIPLRDVSLMISITTLAGENLLNDPEFAKILVINPFTIKYQKQADGVFRPSYHYLKAERCSANNISPEYKEALFTDERLPRFLCLSPKISNQDGSTEDNFIRENLNEDNSQSIWLNLNFCGSNPNPECLKKAEKYKSLFVSVWLMTQYFDSSAPNFTSFKTYKLVTDVTPSLEYTKQITLSSTSIIEDRGILFQQNSESSFFSVENVQTNIKARNGEVLTFFNLLVECSPVTDVIKLKYIKLPELLANFNAILKVILICFKGVSLIMSQYLFFKSFAKRILTKKEDIQSSTVKMGDSSVQIKPSRLNPQVEEKELFPNIFQYWINLFCCKTRLKYDLNKKVMHSLSLENIVEASLKSRSLT